MDEEFFTAYRDALQEAAVLSAAVIDLEHQRKRILAQEIVAQVGVPLSKAEEIARAGQRYGEFLDALKRQRLAAARAEAQAEYLRARWESWRTVNANRRAKS
jgi:hypothetical protein